VADCGACAGFDAGEGFVGGVVAGESGVVEGEGCDLNEGFDGFDGVGPGGIVVV